jgi:hypothetical protein
MSASEIGADIMATTLLTVTVSVALGAACFAFTILGVAAFG